MTQTTPSPEPPAANWSFHAEAPPLWRDLRFLRVIGQAIFVAIMALVLGWLTSNTYQGLKRTNQLPSFAFLSAPSQFQINEGLGPEPHQPSDSFAHAFAIGAINTLRVIGIGLVLTTLLGLIMGVARLSTNWLVRHIAVAYVEVAQNTPLLLQLIFLYNVVFLAMPPVRDAVQLPGPTYLSVRGLAMPALWPTNTTLLWIAFVIVSVLIGWIVRRHLHHVQIETGRHTHAAEIGFGLVLMIGIGGWLLLPTPPFIVSLPQIIGPRYDREAGVIVSPEFVAIVTGLVLYTGAFVAEIVRAGIQSVPAGQWEAARAQGFSQFQILRLIILPQAFRVMIPPLTNQYLNLIKNSSLGGVVGFADIYGVSKTIFQSGQAIPVIIIVMSIYLILDLVTAAIMNFLNTRFQFKVS